MRLALTVSLLMVIAMLIAAERYLRTDSYPRLRIKSVAEPRQTSDPLTITVELASVGKTQLAVSQEQFSIHMFDRERPFLFISDARFDTTAPKVFNTSVENPVTFTVKTSTNRFGGQSWSELTPGPYTLLVYVNSGKSRQFDYQWLGQNYTDEYKLISNDRLARLSEGLPFPFRAASSHRA